MQVSREEGKKEEGGLPHMSHYQHEKQEVTCESQMRADGRMKRVEIISAKRCALAANIVVNEQKRHR